MDLEQLAAEIESLKGAEAERAAESQLSDFMGSYGGQFNNNRNIGLAVLNELDRQGIGAAAVGADKAVIEVLDNMRQEVDALRSDLMAQVAEADSTIKSVQDAVAAVTGGETGNAQLDMPETPPPIEGEMAPPPPPPMEGEMPPPMEGEMPPPPDVMPPEPVPGEAAPQELPPEAVTSDPKTKRNLVLKARPMAAKSYRPPAHILSAINR